MLTEFLRSRKDIQIVGSSHECISQKILAFVEDEIGMDAPRVDLYEPGWWEHDKPEQYGYISVDRDKALANNLDLINRIRKINGWNGKIS
jgi:hypothetical protein